MKIGRKKRKNHHGGMKKSNKQEKIKRKLESLLKGRDRREETNVYTQKEHFQRCFETNKKKNMKMSGEEIRKSYTENKRGFW